MMERSVKETDVKPGQLWAYGQDASCLVTVLERSDYCDPCWPDPVYYLCSVRHYGKPYIWTMSWPDPKWNLLVDVS